VRHAVCVEEITCDLACPVEVGHESSWPQLVPAPGASNVVVAPSGWRMKPCHTPLTSP